MIDTPHASASWLIASIAGALAKSHPDEEGVAETLARLKEQDLTVQAFATPAPLAARACRHLPEALGHAAMTAPAVAAAVAACEDHLSWTRNPGDGDGTDPADYAFTTLIGTGGFFPGDDFEMGLILVAPEFIYRDHYHRAPELYWLLTGPTDWSHASAPYRAFEAGDVIWHRPNLMHATRTLHHPLLAVWTWPRDVAGPVLFR